MLTTDAERAAARQSASGPLPGEGDREKREYVQRMFSDIAPRYDTLNHILALNIDRGWRRRAISALNFERKPDGVYLDVCAGTLDIAASISRQPGFRGVVIGADFAEPMLRAGRRKAEAAHPVAADAVQLPLGDDTVSGAIVAFGIRNVAGLDRCLDEIFRVLEPGARFVILEFSTPRAPVFAGLYRFYFHHVLPKIGGALSGHPTAYSYLPRSVDEFPEEADLARRMRASGFIDISWSRLTFGIVAIHVGCKPSPESIPEIVRMTGSNAGSF
ncbi:MAG TPA: ubiquinone/menaquinone biosynthesis methyltransferase [Gemmatimonadaceae bacterium]|nr:ubiquinone/menaquinone biosynthesis methyltransferase [Gemmatimonadaceae bacterium]